MQFQESNPGLLCTPGKHSTSWATSPALFIFFVFSSSFCVCCWWWFCFLNESSEFYCNNMCFTSEEDRSVTLHLELPWGPIPTCLRRPLRRRKNTANGFFVHSSFLSLSLENTSHFLKPLLWFGVQGRVKGDLGLTPEPSPLTVSPGSLLHSPHRTSLTAAEAGPQCPFSFSFVESTGPRALRCLRLAHLDSQVHPDGGKKMQPWVSRGNGMFQSNPARGKCYLGALISNHPILCMCGHVCVGTVCVCVGTHALGNQCHLWKQGVSMESWLVWKTRLALNLKQSCFYFSAEGRG